MKKYVHARLTAQERAILEDLKRSTGQSESALLRRGLLLVLKEQEPLRSALQVAGRSAGKFKKGPRDLSSNKKHLERFGE